MDAACRNEETVQQITLADRGTLHLARRWSLGWLFALRSERVTGEPASTPLPSALPSDSAAPGAESFEAFYQRREGSVFGYLWRVCGDEQTANDLTQEVFFRAWQRYAQLQTYERPDAWLFRVATNLALNEKRRQRTAGPSLGLIGSEGAGAGDHAAQLAERSALRSALESLPAKQRAAFILRETYGHSCEEVADILRISPAAAKMTLSRARQRLRALYLKESAE